MARLPSIPTDEQKNMAYPIILSDSPRLVKTRVSTLVMPFSQLLAQATRDSLHIVDCAHGQEFSSSGQASS